MIKKILRINVTNKCNKSCITCPISASPEKCIFLPFSMLQNILCGHKYLPLEVVLEGGEPFLHPQIILFLEYLSSVNDVKKLFISTNGDYVLEYYNTLIDIVNRTNMCIQLNVGITPILSSSEHMSICKTLFDMCNKDKKVHIMFDVTYTSEETKEELINRIKKFGIPLCCCSFSIVKAYGALKNTEYPKISNDERNWICYASDGTYFGYDIESRADYELTLCTDLTPIFDVINHRQMWLMTQGFFADLSFENKDNCQQSVKDFQWEYIKTHTPNVSYRSYILDYQSKNNIEIFCECGVYDTEREVVEGLAVCMERTPDMERFYMYKELAMNLCEYISHAKVRDDIKTNEDISCCKC